MKDIKATSGAAEGLITDRDRASVGGIQAYLEIGITIALADHDIVYRNIGVADGRRIVSVNDGRAHRI